MALDFDKELARILNEKKNISSKEAYEKNRLIRKEDLRICTLIKEQLNINLTSIYDLINDPKKYSKNIIDIIQILDSLLKNNKIKYLVTKEGIVRSITRKESRGLIEETLLTEYNGLLESEKDYLGWTIGNAMNLLFTEKYLDEILAIVKNKKNGISRQMFVLALGKTKTHKKRVIKILLNLTFDEEVKLQSIEALTKLRAIEAKERMEKLTKNAERSIIKKKAINFLKKIKEWTTASPR